MLGLENLRKSEVNVVPVVNEFSILCSGKSGEVREINDSAVREFLKILSGKPGKVREI